MNVRTEERQQVAVSLTANTAEAEKAFERFNRLLLITRERLDSVGAALNGLDGRLGPFAPPDREDDETESDGRHDAAESSLSRQEEHARSISEVLRDSLQRSGDDFEQSLGRALSLAGQIARTLSAMHSGRGGNAGLFGFLSGFLSLFGSFEKGGYTGPLPSRQPAGIVHGGEVVFEKQAVDGNLTGLLALRSALRSGSSLSSLLAGAGGAAAAPSRAELGIIVAELRRLRSAWQEVRIEPAITIGQVFDTQRFMIDADRQLQTYKRRKEV